MNFYFRIIIFAFLFPLIVTAQEKNKCHKSTEGTDFWFGFLESRNYQNGHYIEITVTARETTNFTITIGPDNTQFNGTYTVAGNNSQQVTIPWALVEARGSETIQNFGIHLISDKPVNVYALNWCPNSSDVAVIYPVESLGTEYFAMCYIPTIRENNGNYGDGRNSEFLIVATLDSTVIEITPSVQTDSLKPKGVPFKVILNKGQLYQVQSKNRDNSSTTNQGDLTGSQILSDKPVAFYSGSLSTTIPANSCCWDHLYEQIPPVHSWGKEYYIVPLRSREQDRYRIIAAEDNTSINIQGKGTVHLNRGQIHEFILYYYEPTRILSDKPVMIAQFSQSQRVDENFTNKNGDPFMIILSPSSQAKNDVTFVAYSSSQIKNYSVNIITLTSEIGNLRFNGSGGNISIQNQFNPFPGSEYSFAQVALNSGTYRLWNTNPDRGFLAYIYGFGGVESYGYGVGFNLNLVLDIGQSINFEGDTLILCYGETITLDAGPYFDTYKWNTEETTQRITVTEEAEYWATTTTNEGCLLFDSIYIKMSHPETFIGPNRDSCTPYSVILDAGLFEDYLWSTGDTIQKISADKTGTYSVTVFDNYGCPARDTMELTVHEAPDVKIIGSELICGDTTTILKAELTNADPELWNYKGGMEWSSDKPELTMFSSPDSSQTQIEVGKRGDYRIYFKVITKDGCEVTDSFKIVFQATPVSTFGFGEDPKCEGYSKKLIFTGSASPEAEFFWDLDGCMFVDTIGWQQFDVTVGVFLDSPPYIKLYINDHGCLSDTTIHPLGANPVYKMKAFPRKGCDSLRVDFTCELLKPDNVEYKWDFGGNDISTEPNVSKLYGKPGFYDVSLTIVNPVTQCMNGFTLDSMIKVFPTPRANFSADPDLCYPDSFNIIYLNKIDSSFCYWNFEGAHELGENNDSIWVMIDSSMAMIFLQVEEFGCLSDIVTKKVKRKPHFDFYTENEEGCQPYLMEAIATPYDDFLQFTWIHDLQSNVNANSDLYFFKETGNFNIGLIANSFETQCTDTLVKQDWIWVHPKPVAGFKVDYPVATIENSTISFSNLSNPNLINFWDFGDGYYSDSPNPQHTFTELGDFFTQLIVQSDYGCLDTTGFLIKIIPFSVYTPNAFRPDSDIPENKYFMPVGTGVDPQRFNIKIYNRWGAIVFESNNPENKWDGKLKKGQIAPMENYVWVAVFCDIQGFEHKQNGQVILLR